MGRADGAPNDREVSVIRKTLLAAAMSAGLIGPAATAQEESVLKATHGDWEVHCVEAEGGGCLMTQRIPGENDNTLFVAELIALENNPNGVAGMRIRAPIGVFLTRGLSIQIDSGQPVQAPFVFCAPDVCVAEVVLREQDVNLFRRGAKASLTVFAVQAPEQPQTGELSLIGFTKSFEELSN
jgi:invasion protein IalB